MTNEKILKMVDIVNVLLDYTNSDNKDCVLLDEQKTALVALQTVAKTYILQRKMFNEYKNKNFNY